MASYRKPKGTVVRNTWDWNYRAIVSVGGERHGPLTFPPYSYFIWQLLNADQRGIPLHVVGLTVSDDSLGIMQWGFAQGATGSLERSAVPIFAQQGQPYSAQLYVDTIKTANQYEDSLIEVNGFLGSYFGTGPYLPGAPLWVIPAGWALQIYSIEGNTDCGVNFWCAPLAD